MFIIGLLIGLWIGYALGKRAAFQERNIIFWRYRRVDYFSDVEGKHTVSYRQGL